MARYSRAFNAWKTLLNDRTPSGRARLLVTVGSVLVPFGILLAFGVSQTTYSAYGQSTTFPYLFIGIPVGIIGAVLATAGLLAGRQLK